MEAAKPGGRSQTPGWPHWSTEWNILVEREARTHLIGVGRVTRQNVAKMLPAEPNDTLEAFASDRSNQPFNMTVSATASVALSAGRKCPWFADRG
jgi:hypothetical protein